MKSCWIVTTGGRTVLEFRDVPVPQAPPGEIVVRVRAAGLNRGEMIAGGVMHGGPAKLGGTEAAGEVHAVGEGVIAVRPGDRVMGRVLGRERGAFAEYAMMEAGQVMPLPAHLAWEQAAAIPVNFLVVYDALFPYGHLKRGEWLLITGASSATGVAAVQAGKFAGARVIGTSGSDEKLARLKVIGLDAGIRTRAADFAAKVRELTGGRGADLAVNCVGGSMFPECMRALGFGGRLATVGYVDGVYRNEIDLQDLHANRHVVFGVSNSRLDAEGRAASVRGFVRDLLPAFNDGRIVPVIDRVFPFDQLPAAKAYMESNAQVGKIVIRVA
ncbi:MAG: zinc-binding dehydrogenase [Betaproteobacteria bacterium]|nr:zinc-binding dehydrogenase [Betaproteobacteria bacterium]